MKNIASLFALLTILWCNPSAIFAQAFRRSDSLIQKATAEYEKKDYASSLRYYEELLQLPEDQRRLDASGLYDMACVYALNKNTGKALQYLRESFLLSNAQQKQNTVSLGHIMTDSDLAYIRTSPGFLSFVKTHYANGKELLPYYMSKELKYEDLLKSIQKLSEIDDYQIEIDDKVIYWEKGKNGYTYNDWILPLPNFEGLKTKRLVFTNCSFNLDFAWYGNYKEVTQSFPYFAVSFDRCRFLGNCVLGELTFTNSVTFNKCEFATTLGWWLKLDPAYPGTAYSIDSCILHSALLNCSNASTFPVEVSISGNSVTDSAYLRLHFRNISKYKMSGNHFEKCFVDMNLEEPDLVQIKGNYLKNLLLTDTRIKSSFEYYENKLTSKLILNNTTFPTDPSSSIDWRGLNELHLAIYSGGAFFISLPKNGDYKLIGYDPFMSISGEHASDISDSQNFDRLMGMYSMFLNLYKNKGNLEFYNACFIQIKELQSKRLQSIYESNEGFENYFRWKLSRLLKFYVRYGTDPTRAIVISIYLILGFGVFFFFFPSDWDATSKTRLMENYRDFIQKNEKGYIKPFFVLVTGFFLSLVNAFTLSLNAFITLGFGNIPTHGMAKYFCVLEGFLGWFLLSIFTVAMINQVL